MLSVTSKLLSFLCLTCEGHHEPETWKRHHHPHKVRMFGFFAVMYYYYGQIVIPYTMCINCVNKLLSKLKFFTFFSNWPIACCLILSLSRPAVTIATVNGHHSLRAFSHLETEVWLKTVGVHHGIGKRDTRIPVWETRRN